ncbi:MAG: energy transducer TonB [Terriglobales bacterium]
MSAHVALLAVIVFHHPKPIDLTPTWLAWGNADHSYRIVYLPSGDPAADAKLSLPRSAAKKPSIRPPAQAKKPQAKQEHHDLDAKADEGTENTKAGSALGRVVDGPILGHEVHVALPQYPEPQVDRANLPRDLTGDIVIEVTIDSEGNVVETKVVQSIGPDVDEKIVASLRRRHYQPATLDGTPVASHQDVHFHFPS